jgi:glyoxylase-like metal-dependent hydrolase (beta-lactamase superfamily II)/rhodanese-related sulfurtransferase
MISITAFIDTGLGHSSYLVDLEDGRALVIDPARIPDAQLATAERHRLEVAFSADTHTHADYVSGSPELAARGATFLAPADARLETRHRPLHGGDEVDLGRFVLRALPTPGHTPDHLAYLLLDDNRPIALFSGGSLMVGTAGRTDLLGEQRCEELARAQYRSMQRLLTLPDDLRVYPTHGAGSFCAAPSGSERTTTIGRERATNPLLQAVTEDSFVEMLLAALGTLPRYFRRLPELNRRGSRVYGGLPRLPRLSVEDVQRRVVEGAVVVDARPIDAYARGHIPGAVSNALRAGFATWLASVVPDDAPIVFVVDDDQDVDELVRQALNVGYDNLSGVLDGGIDAWRAAELAIASTMLVEPGEWSGSIIDVRQREEFAAGHVPGATSVELAAIAEAAIPRSMTTLMCGHGERAMTAASLLERRGRTDLRVVVGGPEDWSHATGEPVEVAG